MSNTGDEMSQFNDEIRRPFLKYFGGGWTRAPWIIESGFPEHGGYAEPCFGAGSVLLRKKIAKRETVNDLDGRLLNAFEVLRSDTDKLLQQIALTPWHEGEFIKSLERSPDPLEDARRFFFACWASIPGGPEPGPGDFRLQNKIDRRSAYAGDIREIDQNLMSIAKRLERVIFRQIHALSFIESMLGNNWLIYFDPPYVKSRRARKKGYRYEFSNQDHITASELLRSHNGPVIVSGYQSDLYSEIYEAHNWTRVDRAQQANSGKRAIESIWLSPIARDLVEQERSKQPRLL